VPDGSGQSYDVFVSYAHADNEKPLGSAAQYGWVTTLAHNLNTGPGHYRKNLFIDHRLKPGDVFSDDLVTTVGNSTLLLLVLSQNYIDSKWCGKELDQFIRMHANDPEKPTDVFVGELFPFETFTNVPANIQNLCKGLSMHSSGINQRMLLFRCWLASQPRKRAVLKANVGTGVRCTN
jgi:hypothetical protein